MIELAMLRRVIEGISRLDDSCRETRLGAEALRYLDHGETRMRTERPESCCEQGHGLIQPAKHSASPNRIVREVGAAV